MLKALIRFLRWLALSDINIALQSLCVMIMGFLIATDKYREVMTEIDLVAIACTLTVLILMREFFTVKAFKAREKEIVVKQSKPIPPILLNQFYDIFRKSYYVNPVNNESVNLQINQCLHGLLVLAQEITGASTQKLSANVMFYMPMSAYPNVSIRELRFSEVKNFINDASGMPLGILEMRRDLAIKLDPSATNGFTMCQSKKPFMLPVEVAQQNAADRRPFLPGPPNALHSGHAYIEDTNLLEDWFSMTAADTSDLVISSVISHFQKGEGQSVNSLASIAIRTLVNDRDKNRIVSVGVVNIQSNKKDMFDGEQLKSFLSLASPIIYKIGMLLN